MPDRKLVRGMAVGGGDEGGPHIEVIERRLQDEDATDVLVRDMAAAVLCDIWHLDDAKGALHLPHRGATLPWAELQRSGVQHFKMVLPDDPSSYSWAADPELKAVRKLNQFEYGRLLKVAAEGAAAEGGEEEDRVAAAERAYFLSAEEHLHTADLILFCVAGSAYVDVRHHPAAHGWVRVPLQAGARLQIPAGRPSLRAPEGRLSLQVSEVRPSRQSRRAALQRHTQPLPHP